MALCFVMYVKYGCCRIFLCHSRHEQVWRRRKAEARLSENAGLGQWQSHFWWKLSRQHQVKWNDACSCARPSPLAARRSFPHNRDMDQNKSCALTQGNSGEQKRISDSALDWHTLSKKTMDWKQNWLLTLWLRQCLKKHQHEKLDRQIISEYFCSMAYLGMKLLSYVIQNNHSLPVSALNLEKQSGFYFGISASTGRVLSK